MATYSHRPGSKRPHQTRWYDHAGQRHSRQFTARRDAQQFLQQIERARDTGRLQTIGAERETLATLGGRHFQAIKGDLALATRTSYAAHWNRHVRPHPIAGMQLRGITPQAVDDFKSDLRARGVGEASVRRCLILLQGVLGRAVREGVIDFNPAAAVKKPSAKRVRAVQPIALADVERIRAQMDPQGALMVAVLGYAGLRPGEARALEAGHIGSKTLLVEQATDPLGNIKPTKTQQTRSVPLDAELRAEILAAMDSGLVFPRADGRAWTEVQWQTWNRRHFKPAVAAADVKIERPYDLRHSAASRWLHEGHSPVQVAAWLGHSPTMLLSTYAHVIAEL